ncbi:MAG: imidazole glycerol phosphate synthase subunit HisH [Balneolales bacterium]|nr:imidazole glycerol phosphate synthase subunit HisH [Balneolales bacterium]
MIGIIDYKAGNIASVANALERLDTEHIISKDISVLNSCSGIIFPGVGHAASAMETLKKDQLDEWIRETKLPLLGICLGMQLLFEHSTEGDTAGTGLIPGTLQKFDTLTDKVPHMGWNTFTKIQQPHHPLLEGIFPSTYFYYVHSYYAPVNECTLASGNYAGASFASISARENVMGVQFHPEKSGKAGELLLSNFLKLTQEKVPQD